MTNESEIEDQPLTVPWTDRLLSAIEVTTVVLLTFAVYFSIIYQVGWILCGTDVQPRHARLSEVAKSLNENWKAGLLLFIPLFYRSIRGFLERVEEFAGMKTRQAQTKQVVQNPTPPPDQNPKPEQGS